MTAEANATAVERMLTADPILVDVRPAGEAVPGFDRDLVLTAGAPLPWEEYTGGQRTAIVGGALYEGLADDAADAERKLAAGEIRVDGCQQHGCIGSLAGITTASMPVLVVEERTSGRRACCTLFEGQSPARLNYGVYDAEVVRNLRWIDTAIAPVLGEAVRRTGGLPLKPMMARALHMGDELHSRNTAATLVFTRAIAEALFDVGAERPDEVREVLRYLATGDYFFLRPAMAACKVIADAAHGVAGSSVVTAMTFSCREFAIRVSGLGDTWVRGPLPTMESGVLFDGHDASEIEFMGGESPITETVGLGGLAQAAAFPLQRYQGGTCERMAAVNLEMYEVTVGEHRDFRIPFFGYRGTPAGIDVRRVAATGITPAMDIGIAGRGGGQIGAGSFRAPLACFEAAAAALDATAASPVA